MKDVSKAKKIIKRNLHNVRDRGTRIKAELLILGLEIGVKEACGRRGFSRNHWYKWWSRLKKANFKMSGLKEQSRRPLRSPGKMSSRLEKRIRFMGKRGYGAPTIQAHLNLEKITVSRATIGKVLRGRTRKAVKEKIIRKHRRRYELLVPGERVQMDVKYVPYPIDGRQAYNYVAVDECTRLRFVKTFTELNPHNTIIFLNELKLWMPFRIYCLQTDNGFEFTNRLNPHASKWDHPMKIWCDENRIRHRMIPPGEKELNGKVERSHRIDEEFFYQRNAKRSFISFVRAQENWLHFYNTKRLHGGLGFITPKQKLDERREALKNLCFIEPRLERIRLELVENQPIKTKNTQELVDDLEKWLLKL